MEPRVDSLYLGTNIVASNLSTIDQYYQKGLSFCNEHYPEELNRIQTLIDTPNISVEHFYYEYIWCVYVGGFNSKVLASKWDQLKEAYATWEICDESFWVFVKPILANRRKFEGIVKVAKLLRSARSSIGDSSYPADWWGTFQGKYLSSVERIQQLPYMGPVTSHHLARNIGVDTVKPDLHLVRLAKWYNFESPLHMCSHLSLKYWVYLGVIDLILFYTASTFGTKDIK